MRDVRKCADKTGGVTADLQLYVHSTSPVCAA